MAMALDTAPGTFYQHHCMSAVLRYVRVMRRLRALGYNPVVHPAFGEWLVNTYGIV
ncbi:PREDICTED: speriolin-like protein, partial [Pterocles gutturalis]|uniref:speriolin-like protein n=1 Tax=Pterocles gutturalis TaxID=240206 RepID=UPI00052830ED